MATRTLPVSVAAQARIAYGLAAFTVGIVPVLMLVAVAGARVSEYVALYAGAAALYGSPLYAATGALATVLGVRAARRGHVLGEYAALVGFLAALAWIGIAVLRPPLF